MLDDGSCVMEVGKDPFECTVHDHCDLQYDSTVHSHSWVRSRQLDQSRSHHARVYVVEQILLSRPSIEQALRHLARSERSWE